MVVFNLFPGMQKMVRFVVLAAFGAALASPAAAEGVRISLSAKSPAQIEAEIAEAARTVCLKATSAESFRMEAIGRCMKDTVADAKARLATAQPATEQLAQR